MKIAYITDTIFPTETANGIQSVRMCEAFSSLGHEVTFYCCGIKNIFSLWDGTKAQQLERQK